MSRSSEVIKYADKCSNPTAVAFKNALSEEDASENALENNLAAANESVKRLADAYEKVEEGEAACSDIETQYSQVEEKLRFLDSIECLRNFSPRELAGFREKRQQELEQIGNERDIEIAALENAEALLKKEKANYDASKTAAREAQKVYRAAKKEANRLYALVRPLYGNYLKRMITIFEEEMAAAPAPAPAPPAPAPPAPAPPAPAPAEDFAGAAAGAPPALTSEEVALMVKEGYSKVPKYWNKYKRKFKEQGMNEWDVHVGVREQGPQAGGILLSFYSPGGRRIRSWKRAKLYHRNPSAAVDW